MPWAGLSDPMIRNSRGPVMRRLNGGAGGSRCAAAVPGLGADGWGIGLRAARTRPSWDESWGSGARGDHRGRGPMSVMQQCRFGQVLTSHGSAFPHGLRLRSKHRSAIPGRICAERPYFTSFITSVQNTPSTHLVRYQCLPPARFG
jgi:hypothetical protein